MLFAANFKACQTRKATRNYFDTLNAALRTDRTEHEVVVCAPASAFDHYGRGATLAAQNAYPAYNGAYTGETAVEQLDEFGIRTLLIGHSERREILGENQATIAQKFRFFKERGFRIIYCIGEPLEVRQKGETAVLEYLAHEFEGIDTRYENMVIAYEPIWAIGTGLTPTLEEIESTLHAIATRYGKEVLYGGSVKVGNVASIVALPSCSGVLVGSAALVVDDFIAMIESGK
ncbi:MAG: triosephosphate isomerase [Sulfurovum sp. PC08-66]|nr:MAG: triosephosphate isomerase [Sulfurovum sp. PC08-66]KIM12625.1 MAG: triosephosphate isomerase [Sulfuricurvum sp. PC08-66]